MLSGAGFRLAKLDAVFPELARLEDAERRDDAGDQFRRRHVKSRVASFAAGVGQAHLLPTPTRRHSPSAEHLVFVALLDRDGLAGLEFPVDGRERDGDVERDAVPLGQDGLGVGADLVGHLAGAAQRAIAADDDEVDLSALHQVSGGVVGNNIVRDALLRQFPSGEDGALRSRPCLVTINMERFFLGLCGVHWSSGGADIHECQPASVAVR